MPFVPRQHQADPASAARTLFFEADAVAVEEPPDRTEPRLVLALIEQTALDLFQGQVGFLPNQLKQPFLMLLQRRSALTLVGFGFKAAGLPPALRPTDRRRISNHKLACRRPRRSATLNNLDHANPRIVRIPITSLLCPRRPQNLIRSSL